MHKSYLHLERFGTTEVDGIEFGTVHVFPKIDGTNASIWMEDGVLCFGSRNRQLTLDADNAGFMAAMKDSSALWAFFTAYPAARLYGEWLVPHSLKTYREDAWRKFYVFDVMDERGRYLSYDVYKPMLEEYSMDYISPLCTIKDGSYEQFIGWLAANNYLIEYGKGTGEGIVLKNYQFENKFGRLAYAKIVTSEFKERHSKVMGPPSVTGTLRIEFKIAEKYITKALCEKVKAKIENDNDGWSSRNIPQLLNTVYYDLVREDMWEVLKDFKHPIIDFKTLRRYVSMQVKKNLSQLF